MIGRKSFSLLLAFLLPGSAPLSTVEEITYHPRPHALVGKRFHEETSWSLEEVFLEIDGEESELGATQAEGNTELEIELSDEYVQVEGARVRELLRTFERLDARSSVSVD